MAFDTIKMDGEVGGGGGGGGGRVGTPLYSYHVEWCKVRDSAVSDFLDSAVVRHLPRGVLETRGYSPLSPAGVMAVTSNRVLERLTLPDT